MHNNINLVLASDDNYAQHAAITLMSAYEHCDNPKRIKTFILDGGISEEKRIKIRESVALYGGEVQFIAIDVSRFKNMYISFQYTPAIYYRLDLPNILDENIGKCIYVDCDLLFYDNVESLWNIDLCGKPVGAVEDVGLTTSKRGVAEKQQSLGLDDDSLYFNSGVVIMDLDLWRKNNYSQCALELAANNIFKSHDQDVLNKVFLNNWQQIDWRWNIIPPITYLYPKILFSSSIRKKALEARKKPGIIHYAGRYKPWEFRKYNGFNDEYYRLLSKSKFCSVRMPQLSKQNEGRIFSKELVRLKFADAIMNIL